MCHYELDIFPYFYCRKRVRSGKYKDTNLPLNRYRILIFVFSYKINNIADSFKTEVILNIKILNTMKKLSNLISFALFITFISATAVSSAATLPDGTEQFCKTWNISREIVAGTQQSPEAAMAEDQLIINLDNTISVTFQGESLTGTYVIVGGNTWLSISLIDGTSLRLKIMSISETTLQVEHVNAESVHRIFVFTAL